MSENFVRFFDAVSWKLLEVSDEIKEYYLNAPAGQEIKPLLVRIAATHSGKVTRNNGFYLPNEMRVGTSSWTDQYAKPILLHHEDHEDAIGRVVKASYVDISTGIRNSYEKKGIKDEERLSDTLIDAFITGKLSFKESFDVATKYFIFDEDLSGDPDYQGLGYIELLASITDPDAIQKILDGRYLTGSVGASTNKAVCSICRQDWAGDKGMCEHRPGKDYEGKKCVLVAGQLKYGEYSFVNKPADTHSRIIEVNINGVQDFVRLDTSEISDILKENNTTLTLIADSELEEEKEMDPLKVFWGDEYEAIVGDDPWGKQYAEMFADAINAETDPEKQKELRDKKLTAQARKNLPKNVFCKPPDGYPVQDCGHAKSAMAYAKKYNESSSVVACIKRKAARLGCPFQDEMVEDETKNDLGQFVLDYFDIFEDEEIVQMLRGLRDVLKERKLDCAECSDMRDKIKELEAQLNAKSEDKTAEELQNKLTVTEAELKAAIEDLTKLQDTYTDFIGKVKDNHKCRIIAIQSVMNTEFNKEKFEDETKDKSLEDIEKLLIETEGLVDIQKYSGMLNLGIKSNKTVNDPTLKQGEEKAGEDKQQSIEDQNKQLVIKEYLRRSKINKKDADAFLDYAKKQGWIKQ